MQNKFFQSNRGRFLRKVILPMTFALVPTLLLASCGGGHMMMDGSVEPNGAGGSFPTGPGGANPGASNGSGGSAGVSKIGYRQTILPIFQQHCSQCHNPSVPTLNWLDYATAFAAREKIKNRVYILKNMPMGMPLDDSIRKLIAEWVDEGALENEVAGGDGQHPNPIDTGPAPVPPVAAPPVSNPTAPPAATPCPPVAVPPVPSPPPHLAEICLNCHGAGGNPKNPLFPRLAGLQAPYIYKELEAFKARTREDSDAWIMDSFVANLNPDQMKEVAGYFSAQTPVPGPAGDAALIAKGKSFFENGVPDKGVMACASCHGKDGMGAVGPRLASQFSDYLVKQYHAFKDGNRREATMMPGVVKNLDEESMKAIAAYLQAR